MYETNKLDLSNIKLDKTKKSLLKVVYLKIIELFLDIKIYIKFKGEK